MVKSIISVLALFLVGCSITFGSMPPPPNPPMPPRSDRLDASSSYAQLRLARAEKILATLVSDPSNYHLILSSRSSFGGEAIPPHVYSDKPSMIIYQGAISPNRSDEEIAFMMAHELGHLNLHHMEKMDEQIGKVMNGNPAGISGAMTFAIYQQKFQEQEADLFGLSLYKQAGYNTTFFPHTLSLLKINPNIHYGSSKIFAKEIPSLSMKDSHFSMLERFELLVALA